MNHSFHWSNALLKLRGFKFELLEYAGLLACLAISRMILTSGGMLASMLGCGECGIVAVKKVDKPLDYQQESL